MLERLRSAPGVDPTVGSLVSVGRCSITFTDPADMSDTDVVSMMESRLDLSEVTLGVALVSSVDSGTWLAQSK